MKTIPPAQILKKIKNVPEKYKHQNEIKDVIKSDFSKKKSFIMLRVDNVIIPDAFHSIMKL